MQEEEGRRALHEEQQGPHACSLLLSRLGGQEVDKELLGACSGITHLGCTHLVQCVCQGVRPVLITSYSETKRCPKATAGRPQVLRDFSPHRAEGQGPGCRNSGCSVQHSSASAHLQKGLAPCSQAQVRPDSVGGTAFSLAYSADAHGQSDSFSSVPSQEPWTLAQPSLQKGPWRAKSYFRAVSLFSLVADFSSKEPPKLSILQEGKGKPWSGCQ